MRRALALLFVSLVACGGGSEREPSPGWVVIDGIEFPLAMAEAHPEVIEAYVFAAKHPEVLRYMPCYCGCEAEAFAHDSNYDCFIDAIEETDTGVRVSPDPMGFG